MDSLTPESEFTKRGLPSHWVAAVLFAAALLLLLNLLPFRSPVEARTTTPSWATDATPVRSPKDRPEYQQAVYSYRCSGCHIIIPTSTEVPHERTQHREIHLEHGINARCLNCHHPTNRDAFVDDAGSEIPWNEPWRVCSKCHGPVYRDWQHGAHGRTNGFWDKGQGEQTRLRCIDCHDPHHPTFEPLQPAPGPRTLRMGQQDYGPQLELHDPLRLKSTLRPAVSEGD
jgi:hypothetical protein